MLILCFPFLLQAQDVQKKSLEIGLDISRAVSIFNGNRTASGEFVFRKPYNKSAIRARLGMSFGLTDQTANMDMNTSNSSRSNIYMGIGYERHVFLIEKWTLYYGGELGSFSDRSHAKQEIPTQNRYADSFINTQGASLSPILGIRFKVNDRISFATESRFSLVGEKTTKRNETTSGGSNRSVEEEEFSFSGAFTSPYSLYLLIRI
jgi:hypothetical protein